MPTFTADALCRATLEDLVRARPHLRHLRVRVHGPLLILESGPRDDASAHARFRRVTIQWWQIEMPSGRDWQKIPGRAPLSQAFALVAQDFPWTLEPLC